jgi:hypothetical protein
MKKLQLLLLMLLALPIGMLAQGSSWQTATLINNGASGNGSLDKNNTDAWFKIEVPEEGRVQLTATPDATLNIQYVDLCWNDNNVMRARKTIRPNTSTTTLDFVVKKDIQPNIVDVYATNNPARESTTFVVEHNFCGADLDLAIDIMDTSGRLLWSTSESGTATTNTIAYKWDLCTDSGAKLNTGIYLYRIKLSSNGSSYASKAKKLLIINN